MNKESFIFYRSFYEALTGMSKEKQADCLMAIANYALNGEEPELTPEVRLFFTLVKPQIDANNQRFLNGKKGGRPKKTETKPKNNQTETETKPNVNVNVNDNVNNITPKNNNSNELIILSPYKGFEKCSCDCERKAKFQINDKKFCGQHTRIELTKLGRLDLLPQEKRFIKPTVEEIALYCRERQNTISAEQFFNFYESKGWRVGNQPMKDWKAAVRTWEAKEKTLNASKDLVRPEDYKPLSWL